MSRRAPAAEPQPAVSVVQVAWMTHITEGRYVLGIGSGGYPSDAKLRGLRDMPAPCKRTTEALRLMKEVRRSAPFPFDGDFYSVSYSRTTGTRAPFRVASSTSDSTDGPPTHRPNRLRAAVCEPPWAKRALVYAGANTSRRDDFGEAAITTGRKPMRRWPARLVPRSTLTIARDKSAVAHHRHRVFDRRRRSLLSRSSSSPQQQRRRCHPRSRRPTSRSSVTITASGSMVPSIRRATRTPCWSVREQTCQEQSHTACGGR